MQQPSLGRVVIAVVDPAWNNGAGEAPAEIVRVWSEGDGFWTVNVKANLDGEGQRWMTSVRLYESAELARAAGGTAHVAYWPARV